ncbi:hypothetical protein FW320_10185 [Azospirillum sp. Vi22]|uniref:hypothetical protein n=1 Tax=Azospirillum baldaniorum TaxID=1064539 RepID=UPI0011AD4BC8|nr:hypothetical protein [Azospirillum baldaniorum]NUB06537.1 hypothetical protein [Azospirillum baldaniorum]TWA62316.1 hypothetical protein FBZ84_11191 [Azospirillum baldaniorum]
MLHIKDIEAFAHINEALARDHAAARGENDSVGHQPGHHPAMHPAMLIAMAATGRLKPEDGADGKTPQAEAAALLARMLGVRRG